MNVLMVSPWLRPHGGGLERYAERTAAELVARGHDVTLVGHATRPLPSRDDGVRRVPVAPDVTLGHAPLGRDLPRTLRRLLRAGRFDVVNAHTPVPGAAEAASRRAQKAGVPFAVTYHAGRLESQSPLLAAPARVHAWTLERAMIRRARVRFAVSDYVARHVFDGDAWLAPPGVDTTLFREVSPRVPGRILFVGPPSRAYAWKGLAVLYAAFRRLAPLVPEAHLRVVGEGDLRGAFEQRAARDGLAHRFDVVGRVGDDALAREYSQASVVALPSLTPAESFGMVLAEANACGRPVVGSDVGGIPCFVRDGRNGLLAPPGDAPQWSAALHRLLADDALAARLGEDGRRVVSRDHDWGTLARRYGERLAMAA